MLTFTQKIQAYGITGTDTPEKKPRKPRKDRRPENPEKLSKRARSEFLQGIADLDADRRRTLADLLNAAANASLWDIEQRLHRLRIAQATNAFLFHLWDLIIDLDKRIPSAEEMEEFADAILKRYHFTADEWNWKECLREALRYRSGFERVRDLFL